jgi:hypothetical protein
VKLRSCRGLRSHLRHAAPVRSSARRPALMAPVKSDDSVDGKVAAMESGDSDTKPTLHAPGTDTANGSSAVSVPGA